MALTACHECKQQISSEAAACPHCGAKPKKGLSGCSIVLLVFAAFLVYTCTSAMQGSSAPPKPAKSAEELQADKELQLAIAAGLVLKKQLKDPSSFKVTDFVIYHDGAACYEYSAKNSFNATLASKAVFLPPAALLTSERDGNKFVKAWNSTCTRGGGASRAGGLNLLGVWN